MKEYKIPNHKKLVLFIGRKEYPLFTQYLVDHYDLKEVIQSNYPGKGHGRTYKNVMWIDEVEIGLIGHELSHFMDYIYYEIGCETESEFKAYLREETDRAVFGDLFNLKDEEEQ